MSEDRRKVDVELSRRLYNMEYEALIRRKADAQMKREEEEKKAEEGRKRGGRAEIFRAVVSNLSLDFPASQPE